MSAAIVAGLALGTGTLPTAAQAATVRVVYGWGNNSSGQVGVGPVGGAQLTPAQVTGQATNVVALAGGVAFSLALHADGTVWAWGDNSFGELGNGTYASSFAPVQVLGLPPIAQVAGGFTHAAAVGVDGSVWTWGSNNYGELGNGQSATTGDGAHNLAIQVAGIGTVKQLAAGANFTVALRTNGEVWTWGRGDHGQLGDGTHAASRPTPARNQAVYGMTQVSAGFDHALALRPGSVWAWGANYMGQLGNGSAVPDSASPVLVDRHTQNAIQIVAGADHNLTLDADGSIWAWGDNLYGALGIGAVDDPNGPFGHGRSVPVHLAVSGISQLSAGSEQSLALRSDGTLLAWGYDLFGLLGNGTQGGPAVVVPTVVSSVSGVTTASVGGNTVLAVANAVAVPDVRGEIRSAAVGTLQAEGLRVQLATTPDDRLCNHVGEVLDQSPAGGTVVAPGTSVWLLVAVRPAAGCF